MKRTVLFSLFTVLAALPAAAQTYLWNAQGIAWQIEDTIPDSLAFSDLDMTLWSNGTALYSTSTDDVDSIAFAKADLTTDPLYSFYSSFAFDATDRETYGATVETVTDDEDDFVENSTFSSFVCIAYDGDTACVTYADANGAALESIAGVTVAVSGAHVTIDSSIKAVGYRLSGRSTDGSFKIYATNKFMVALDGVSLLNPTGAAFNNQSSKRTFIVLTDGTENTFEDGDTYDIPDGEKMKACMYSDGQLIFSGGGCISVTSNYNHAICSEEYVRVCSGTITVPSAVNDGLHTSSATIFAGGIVDITSEGDAVQCGDESITITGGYISVTTTGEKSHGLKAETDLTMTGGCVHASVSGGASKGISINGDLTFNGGKYYAQTTGAGIYDADELDVSASAGIKADGLLTINGGDIFCYSTGAGGKGLNSNSVIIINGGLVQAVTLGAVYRYGEYDSSPKGIKGDSGVVVNGGVVMVYCPTTDDGSEGIESKDSLEINNGTVMVYAKDDCINATNHIQINGGNVYCYGSGNDAVDSNGTLSFTGGTLFCAGTATPEGGIDCDENRFAITGGTIVGVGGDTSTPTTSACTQPSLIYKGNSATKGKYYNISSSTGESILTFYMPVSYSQQVAFLISSPDFVKGSSYTLSYGGTTTGGTECLSIFTGDTYTDGTTLASTTLSSLVTTVQSSGGGSTQPGGGSTQPGGGNMGGGGGFGW